MMYLHYIIYTDHWFVLGITVVQMWLKYCLLIGHNTYELLVNFTLIIIIAIIIIIIIIIIVNWIIWLQLFTVLWKWLYLDCGDSWHLCAPTACNSFQIMLTCMNIHNKAESYFFLYELPGLRLHSWRTAFSQSYHSLWLINYYNW